MPIHWRKSRIKPNWSEGKLLSNQFLPKKDGRFPANKNQIIMKAGMLVLLSALTMYSATAQRIAPDTIALKKGSLVIQPINHASVVLTAEGKTIYVDPVGGAAKYQGLAAPDIILITDIHGDHFDPATLRGIMTKSTMLIVPQSVADKFKDAGEVVMANGDHKKVDELS